MRFSSSDPHKTDQSQLKRQGQRNKPFPEQSLRALSPASTLELFFHRRINGSCIHKFGWIIKISPAEKFCLNLSANLLFMDALPFSPCSWNHFAHCKIISQTFRPQHVWKYLPDKLFTAEDDPPAKPKMTPAEQPCLLLKEERLDPTYSSSFCLAGTISLVSPSCPSPDQWLCRTTHRCDHRACEPDFRRLLQEQLYWV